MPNAVRVALKRDRAMPGGDAEKSSQQNKAAEGGEKNVRKLYNFSNNKTNAIAYY